MIRHVYSKKYLTRVILNSSYLSVHLAIMPSQIPRLVKRFPAKKTKTLQLDRLSHEEQDEIRQE